MNKPLTSVIQLLQLIKHLLPAKALIIVYYLFGLIDSYLNVFFAACRSVGNYI